MTPEIKKIYEAHLAFELAYFQKKNLKAVIKEEVEATFIWLEGVKLKDISSPESIKSFLKRNIEAKSLTAEQKAYINSIALTFHKEAIVSDYTVSDYIFKERYHEIVEELISRKEWRDQFIENTVKNPLYGQIIADTLYDGLKAFASQGGPAKDSVGGSLFNLGKGILGAALSGVSETFDKNIKRFIAENLSKTLKQSEQHLKDRFNDENLLTSSKKIWNKIEDIKISSIAKKIKKKDVEYIIEMSEKLVADLLSNEAVRAISDIAIDHFFTYHMNSTITEILEDNSITKEIVIRELEEFLIPVIDKANKDGYLKARLDAHLLKFYSTL